MIITRAQDTLIKILETSTIIKIYERGLFTGSTDPAQDLSNCVQVTAQNFTPIQQGRARQNIGAQSAAEIGDTDTDFLSILLAP
jgi:hypothetical protein